MDAARVGDRLRHMLDAIEAIERYTRGKAIGDYVSDQMLSDAVERNLERLSEASRHLPTDLKAQHPEIPWRQVADLGNLLRHAYDRVDAARVWQIIVDDLPVLKVALLSMRSTLT